jgi:hypothetical protein
MKNCFTICCSAIFLAFIVGCTVITVMQTVFLEDHKIISCRIEQIGDVTPICAYGQSALCGTYANILVNFTNGDKDWVVNALCSEGNYNPLTCYTLYCEGCAFWCQIQQNGQWLIASDPSDKRMWFILGVVSSVLLVLCTVGALALLVYFVYSTQKQPRYNKYHLGE